MKNDCRAKHAKMAKEKQTQTTQIFMEKFQPASFMTRAASTGVKIKPQNSAAKRHSARLTIIYIYLRTS
jgi:hypothetical protein